MNILIILIDSLRFDAFNKEVMPNLYSLYEKRPDGAYFEKNFSGGNATQAAVFSLFYSMPSNYWNTFTSRQLSPVLISHAMEQKYEMGIFSSGRLVSPEFYKNVFSNIPNLRLESKGGTKYERDADMQKDFTNFVLTHDKSKPFFGFLFYDTVHGFDYPPDFKEKFTPAKTLNYLSLSADTDPAPYMNRYKNAANYVDGEVSKVFTLLKQQGLSDNTVVIISGDHGQEINDTRNNFWGHNSNFTKYQIQTPLVVFWPGKKGGAFEYRVSHYDIVPTLMQDVFGCKNQPQDYSIGFNLFDATVERKYVVLTSYTDKAVAVEGKVSVLDNYGTLDTYDDDYKKTQDVDTATIAQALKTMSTFYK